MKIKNSIVAIFVTLLFLVPGFTPANAVSLPDLTLSQFTIDRMEWRQMPDCDHNACQNLVWKVLIEFNFIVQNRGQAAAQIPNGNFESSAIRDTLLRKRDNRFVDQVLNWESVPNPLEAGAATRLTGRMYIQEDPALIRPQDEYTLCLTLTDRPSDNQNWNLVESNVNNNTLCTNFILNIPSHTLPNPAVINMNVPGIVWRNADNSVDFQVVYVVQNTTKQVYVPNFGRHLVITGNGASTEFCTGNISPGMHGLETKTLACLVHLPAGTARGNFIIKAVVDANNRVVESNELDNTLEKQIQIL